MAVLLVIPVVALTILEAIDYQNAIIVLWSSLFHAAFYFYTTSG